MSGSGVLLSVEIACEKCDGIRSVYVFHADQRGKLRDVDAIRFKRSDRAVGVAARLTVEAGAALAYRTAAGSELKVRYIK